MIDFISREERRDNPPKKSHTFHPINVCKSFPISEGMSFTTFESAYLPKFVLRNCIDFQNSASTVTASQEFFFCKC